MRVLAGCGVRDVIAARPWLGLKYADVRGLPDATITQVAECLPESVFVSGGINGGLELQRDGDHSHHGASPAAGVLGVASDVTANTAASPRYAAMRATELVHQAADVLSMSEWLRALAGRAALVVGDLAEAQSQLQHATARFGSPEAEDPAVWAELAVLYAAAALYGQGDASGCLLSASACIRRALAFGLDDAALLCDAAEALIALSALGPASVHTGGSASLAEALLRRASSILSGKPCSTGSPSTSGFSTASAAPDVAQRVQKLLSAVLMPVAPLEAVTVAAAASSATPAEVRRAKSVLEAHGMAAAAKNSYAKGRILM
jgi:hypothetical protein